MCDHNYTDDVIAIMFIRVLEQNNETNERKQQGVDPLSITLNPMEIRTFSCEITRYHAAK